MLRPGTRLVFGKILSASCSRVVEWRGFDLKRSAESQLRLGAPLSTQDLANRECDTRHGSRTRHRQVWGGVCQKAPGSRRLGLTRRPSWVPDRMICDFVHKSDLYQMAYLEPHFDPDVFVSYSHGDPRGTGDAPLRRGHTPSYVNCKARYSHRIRNATRLDGRAN
jgi:hypothetical protein